MSEIRKISLFDPRLVQKNFTKTVLKSGSSLAVTEFPTQNPSDNSISIDCNISRNNFIDRYVIIESDITLRATITYSAGNAPADLGNVFTPGKDFSVRPYPLQKMTVSTSGNIGGERFSQQTDQIENSGLLDYITETEINKKYDGASYPSNFTKFAHNRPGFNTSNFTNISGSKYNSSTVPSSGSYSIFQFGNGGQNSFNTFVKNATASVVADSAGTNIKIIRGIPVGNGTATTFVVDFKFHTVEPLRFSPFQFIRDSDFKTAFFGIDTLGINLSLSNDFKRMFQVNHIPNATVSFSSPDSSAYSNVKLRIQSLTPPVGFSLPTKNIIPFFEMRHIPNNISFSNNNFLEEKTLQISTVPISMGVIPDCVYCSVVPLESSYKISDNKFMFPIVRVDAQVDSSSTLLSNHNDKELYKINYDNGVKVSYPVYIGSSFSGDTPTETFDPYVHMRGAPLCLRFGKDICLPEYLAPGVVGSFNLILRVTFMRPLGSSLDASGTARTFTGATLNTVLVNFGRIECQNGTKPNTIIGSIDKSDALEAKSATSYQTNSDGSSEKMIGGNFFNRLINTGKHYANKIGKFVEKKGPGVAEKIAEEGAKMAMKRAFGSGRPVTIGGSKKDITRFY